MQLPIFIPLATFLEHPSSIVGQEAREMGAWTTHGVHFVPAAVIPAHSLQQLDNHDVVHELMQLYHHLFNNDFVSIEPAAHSQQLPYLINVKGDTNFIHSLRDQSPQEPLLIKGIPSADVSGFVYTQHPSLTQKSHLLIQSYWGSPHPDQPLTHSDLFIVDVRTWNIISRQLGYKLARYQPILENFDQVAVPKHLQATTTLTDHQVITLAKQAHFCKQHKPYDLRITWSLWKNELTWIDVLKWEGETDGRLTIQDVSAEHSGSGFHTDTRLHHPSISLDVPPGLHLVAQGLTLQAGRVHGRGMIIPPTNPFTHLAQIQVGDIVITDHWQPQFLPILTKIAGLILEQNLYAVDTINAVKKYGIPTLTRVAHATRLLKNHQAVTIQAKMGQPGLIFKSTS